MKLVSTKSIFSRTVKCQHFCFRYVFVKRTKWITQTRHFSVAGPDTVICGLPRIAQTNFVIIVGNRVGQEVRKSLLKTYALLIEVPLSQAAIRAHNYVTRLSKQGRHNFMAAYTKRDKTEHQPLSSEIVNYAQHGLRSHYLMT